MYHQKPRLGFTLIELLVVVLIIGILAAVALLQYQRAVTKSRYIGLSTIAKSLNDSIQRYFLEKGNYPIQFADLDISFGGGPSSHPRYYTFSNGDYCELRTSNKELYCASSNGLAIIIEYTIQRRTCRATTSYSVEMCKLLTESTLSCNPQEQKGNYCNYVYKQ